MVIGAAKPAKSFYCLLFVEQIIQALAVERCERAGQRRMNAPVGTRYSLSADSLDNVS